MNYREKMKEYLKEPDEYSSQYGKWGILNREQRHLIKRLLKEMDSADEVIKHQYFEIERLNKRIEDLNTINEEHQILNGMIRKELQQKENIIKEVREYIEKNYIYIQHVTYNKLLEILDKGE